MGKILGPNETANLDPGIMKSDICRHLPSNFKIFILEYLIRYLVHSTIMDTIFRQGSDTMVNIWEYLFDIKYMSQRENSNP